MSHIWEMEDSFDELISVLPLCVLRLELDGHYHISRAFTLSHLTGSDVYMYLYIYGFVLLLIKLYLLTLSSSRTYLVSVY